MPRWTRGVTVAGNYAYVVGGSVGLFVIDVSVPRSPTEVGHCNTGGHACVVEGNHVYVAAGGNGLRIVDVSTPGVPTEVGSFYRGEAYDVALAGRVYCNVDATEAAVAPGDLLTTSDRPGHAMRVTEPERAAGAILGKAMESLDQGATGQILVLVTLQ